LEHAFVVLNRDNVAHWTLIASIQRQRKWRQWLWLWCGSAPAHKRVSTQGGGSALQFVTALAATVTPLPLHGQKRLAV